MIEFIEEEKKELLDLARASLGHYLSSGKKPIYIPRHPRIQEQIGAFVTLRNHARLRGCIGRFNPTEPLYQIVIDSAIAASNDPRFPSVQIDELDHLRIEISLLSEPKLITALNELRVGMHGLIVAKKMQQGILLPQVATENAWDALTFLEHACMKAGLKRNDWQAGASIYSFTAQVFSE